MNYDSYADSILIEGLGKGDEKAFRAIYLRYWKKLFLVACRKASSREVAEELVQNLFVSLWEKREQVSIEHLERYLFTSIKYLVLNHLKSKIAEDRYLTHSREYFSGVDGGTEFSVALLDLSEALAKGVARLPEKTQTIFRLNRLEHNTVKEISRDLNLPPRTVEYHLTQALKSLRLHLKDFVLVLLLSLSLGA